MALKNWRFEIRDWSDDPKYKGTYYKVMRVAADGEARHTTGYPTVASCEAYIARNDPNSIRWLDDFELLVEYDDAKGELRTQLRTEILRRMQEEL